MSLAGVPITLLALADEMVGDVEKHSGCVFVDMGAETTSVAVFKGNILRHLAVIPLGGNNITRDIASLSIAEPEAERLKKTYGEAVYEDMDQPRNNIVTEGGLTFAFEDFAWHVEARQEEIIKNVAKQIELSKYSKSQLLGGIIITGGAANMKGIEKAFARYTDFTKIQVVRNIRTQVRIGSGVPTFNQDGSCNGAIVLLEKGDSNCCGGSLETQKDIFKAKQEAAEKAAAEKAAAEKAAADKEAEQKRLAEENEAKIAAQKEEKKRKRNAWKKKWLGKLGNLTDYIFSEEENSDE
jgi:cell division protein FtsA